MEKGVNRVKDNGIRALVCGGLSIMLGVGMGMTERKGTIPSGGSVSCGSPWSPNDYGLAKIFSSVTDACVEALGWSAWIAGGFAVLGVAVLVAGGYAALIAVGVHGD